MAQTIINHKYEIGTKLYYFDMEDYSIHSCVIQHLIISWEQCSGYICTKSKRFGDFEINYHGDSLHLQHLGLKHIVSDNLDTLFNILLRNYDDTYELECMLEIDKQFNKQFKIWYHNQKTENEKEE